MRDAEKTRDQLLSELTHLRKRLEATGLDRQAQDKVRPDAQAGEQAQSSCDLKGMFSGLLQTHHAIMLLIDPEKAEIVDASPAACAYYGYGRETFQGKSLLDINADAEELVRQRLADARTAGINSLAVRHLLANGDIRDVQLNSGPVTIDDRTLLLTTIYDITERKKAEAALKESEERFRTLFENAAIGLSRTDLTGRFIHVNRKFCEILGYELDEVLRLGIKDITHPDDLGRQLDLHGRIFSKQISHYVIEKRNFKKDGSIIWTRATVSPEFDSAGQPVSSIGVIEDISDRKKVEEGLHRSEEKYRVLFQMSPSPITMARLSDSRFVDVNDAFTTLNGFSREEVIGKTAFEVGLWPYPEERERLTRLIREQGRYRDEEVRVRVRNGEIKTLLMSGEKTEIDGEPCMIASARDITRQVRLNDELRQAKAEAERANRAKSDFLANMSHEIRTPLNGIMGMTELALTSTRDAEVQEKLHLVKESGTALLGIVNDILDLSKIEAGKIELERKPFCLCQLIEATLKALSIGAKYKGVKLLHSVDPDVPQRMQGDPGRIRQVLTNLIGNAIKFTEDGTVTVFVSLDKDQPHSQARLRFMVADTGIGIPADKQSSIFDAFSQVGNPAHMRYGGTGLGLAISKRLVEMMGGRIWVKSEPGKGATFTFTALVDPAEERREPEQANQRVYGLQERRLSVLVVEDNLVNRMLAEGLLGQRGHEVVSVESGQEALTALRLGTFDLVLMDIRMPGMDGLEATRRIRSGEAGDPAVPIIALTAHALKSDRERFLAIGMDDYISKPIDLEELDRVLARQAQR